MPTPCGVIKVERRREVLWYIFFMISLCGFEVEVINTSQLCNLANHSNTTTDFAIRHANSMQRTLLWMGWNWCAPPPLVRLSWILRSYGCDVKVVHVISCLVHNISWYQFILRSGTDCLICPRVSNPLHILWVALVREDGSHRPIPSHPSIYPSIHPSISCKWVFNGHFHWDHSIILLEFHQWLTKTMPSFVTQIGTHKSYISPCFVRWTTMNLTWSYHWFHLF